MTEKLNSTVKSFGALLDALLPVFGDAWVSPRISPAAYADIRNALPSAHVGLQLLQLHSDGLLKPSLYLGIAYNGFSQLLQQLSTTFCSPSNSSITRAVHGDLRSAFSSATTWLDLLKLHLLESTVEVPVPSKPGARALVPVGYFDEMGRPVLAKMNPKMLECCQVSGFALLFAQALVGSDPEQDPCGAAPMSMASAAKLWKHQLAQARVNRSIPVATEQEESWIDLGFSGGWVLCLETFAAGLAA